MPYCSPSDVRQICELTSDDISDQILESIIRTATVRLNMDINCVVKEEEATYIDEYRQNKKDGVNTTFYVQNSYRYHLGDHDNDGDVDENDVIVYIYDSTTDTKSQATVSSVDATAGSVVLAVAPSSNQKVKITYSRAPIDEEEPDLAVKEACKMLSASLAYMRLRVGDYSKLQLGDFSVSDYTGGGSTSRSFRVLNDYYLELVDAIRAQDMVRMKDIIGLPFLKHYDGER